jgi:hypothetical protein
VTVSPDGSGGGANGTGGAVGASGGDAMDQRLLAVIMAARYHGMELDPNEFRLGSGETCRNGCRMRGCGRARCGCAGAT